MSPKKTFCGKGGTAYLSQRTDWETPDALFQKLDEEFEFTLDVCATKQNTKCKRFFSPQNDGLSQPWGGVCWMNPPYGRGVIGKWIQKAYEESQKGATVVCLIPSRTDTRWFHRYVMKAEEIRLVQGRVKFELDGQKLMPCPFPSAIVIFKSKIEGPPVLKGMSRHDF